MRTEDKGQGTVRAKQIGGVCTICHGLRVTRCDESWIVQSEGQKVIPVGLQELQSGVVDWKRLFIGVITHSIAGLGFGGALWLMCLQKPPAQMKEFK